MSVIQKQKNPRTDIRKGVPDGFVHINGKRLQPICRKMGINYSEAMTGLDDSWFKFKAIIEGVIVPVECHQTLLMEIRARDSRAAARKSKAEKKALDQKKQAFRDRFPRAPESIVDIYHSWEDVFSEISQIPLRHVLQAEYEAFGLEMEGQTAVLLTDGGATVTRLYGAGFPFDWEGPDPSEVSKKFAGLGITVLQALSMGNRLVKMITDCQETRASFYSTKDRLLSCWQPFLTDGRVVRHETLKCWYCARGCPNCGFSTNYKTRTLYEHLFHFPGHDQPVCFHSFSKPTKLSSKQGADLPFYGRRFTEDELKLGVNALEVFSFLNHLNPGVLDGSISALEPHRHAECPQ